MKKLQLNNISKTCSYIKEAKILRLKIYNILQNFKKN